MENEEKKYNLENPNEEPVQVDEEPLVLEANKSAQNIEEMNVSDRIKYVLSFYKNYRAEIADSNSSLPLHLLEILFKAH